MRSRLEPVGGLRLTHPHAPGLHRPGLSTVSDGARPPAMSCSPPTGVWAMRKAADPRPGGRTRERMVGHLDVWSARRTLILPGAVTTGPERRYAGQGSQPRGVILARVRLVAEIILQSPDRSQTRS